MIIPGEWRRLGEGPLRPAVRVKVQAPDGSEACRYFLVDSGADRTVLCRAALDDLAAGVPEALGTLGGVGGEAAAGLVNVVLIFEKDDGGVASVGGPYAAFLEAEASDEDILGRDVLNNFDLIKSYRRREVLLLAPPHSAAVVVE